MFRKIIAASDNRKSRLHDRRGQLVPISSIAYLPHVIICEVLFKTIGWRRRRPWISYKATKYLDRKLNAHPCPIIARLTYFAPGCLFASEGYLVEMPKS